MLKPLYIKKSGLILLMLACTLIGLALFLPSLIDINKYRTEILTTLQKALNRKVAFTTGRFSMNFGPTVTLNNLTVKELDGVNDCFKAKKVNITLAVFPLFSGKVVLRDIAVDEADLNLRRNPDGRLNLDDLIKGGDDKPSPVKLHKVIFRKSRFFWQDLAAKPQPLSMEFRNINLELDNVSAGHKGNVKASLELPSGGGSISSLAISGKLTMPKSGKPFSEAELNLNADLKQFEPGRFWPYYGRYIPFGNVGGRVDLSTSFKGRLAEFSAKGKLRLSNISVNWPTVFHHPVDPKLALLDYEIKRSKDSIDMSYLNFSADGFRIKGSCRLSEIQSGDLRITAKGVTEPFRLEGLRQWIPYGIIPKDTSEYIEQHITGGIFKLDIGTLDGKVSQIVHMEKGTNYNVLHIKGTVEKGIVSYGKGAPEFNNIRAGLEMLGKDFILSHATGQFGQSPFKADGRITNYPLDSSHPCEYPFQMEIVPRSAEVAWLARFVRGDKLIFNGNSRLILKGNGIIPAYRLSGEWDLRQAAYAFPEVVRKPVGMANTLNFSAVLGPTETKINSVSYNLAPFSLSGKGVFGYGNTPYLGYELQTNQFMMGDSLPILLGWQSYAPQGRVQAHISSKGNPSDFTSMDYNGTISLNGFSFRPSDKLLPIRNINGLITLKGNGLETSNINVRYGGSSVFLKGRIRSFADTDAEMTLLSPEFKLRDIASGFAGSEASIRNLHASVRLKADDIKISAFSGLFNNSDFNLSGTVSRGGEPGADLALTSKKLDLDDLLLVVKSTSSGGSESGGDVKLKLNVANGNYGKLNFSRLRSTLSSHGGVFYLQDLEAGLYGGNLSAKGRIAPGGGDVNRYDLTVGVSKVDAAQLFRVMDVSREVSGKLNLQGNITARGSSLAELKRSALGNIKVRLHEGSLRKFNVLSKLFSILNVSQLLKFQLPDMVKDGMPFNSIRGSFAVKDGVASTSDLLVNSDAVNVSLVGSADLVKEELNFIIGVQPLQTVDKIVNHIPVFGWILTGKEKDVVTVYFEAKGNWSDPQVAAIPVKSMAVGVLNIFRRVFELPVRLFTDTGEVILGK
jgi:uncharacterized protein involved in outer membrane biogenesis